MANFIKLETNIQAETSIEQDIYKKVQLIILWEISILRERGIKEQVFGIIRNANAIVMRVL